QVRLDLERSEQPVAIAKSTREARFARLPVKGGVHLGVETAELPGCRPNHDGAIEALWWRRPSYDDEALCTRRYRERRDVLPLSATRMALYRDGAANFTERQGRRAKNARGLGKIDMCIDVDSAHSISPGSRVERPCPKLAARCLQCQTSHLPHVRDDV